MQDILIVGGGSAGAVLAARLSERSTRRVMLVEAGRDLTAASLPQAVASPYPGRAYFDPSLIWQGLQVTTGGVRQNDPASRPRMPYTQGRVLGGGSAINGIGANRGAPSDYDDWEAAGATGWNAESVLPFFRKLERDLDIADHHHGRDGPMPIRRVPASDRTAFVDALIRALARRGVAEHPDQNGAWQDGVFPLAANCDEAWRRVPTAIAYLTPAVRARPNLTILTEVTARRLVIDQGRVTGVVAVGAGGEMMFRAAETILACGAIHTPILMMRSGLGPGEDLRQRGIAVEADLPGVGANLMEHPSAGIAAYLPPASRTRGPDRHHIPAIWRFSSGLDGEPSGDMHIAMIQRGSWHGLGRRMGIAYVWVNRSHGRGTVRLGRDPNGPPDVDLRLLSDERDRVRLTQGFRLAAGLMTEVAATGAAGDPFPAVMSDRARTFGRPTWRNAVVTGLAGLGIDLAGPFGAGLFERLVAPPERLADLIGDASALDRFLDRAATGVWHVSGTARMGRADDRQAVTGADGRVHGIAGLRACDASLFPTIPSANLNIPVIMVAERIASLIDGTA